MLLFRAIAAALGLRLRVEGADRLPPGPCLLAAAPHRTWIDPFVVFFALPLEPRPWFLGDGEAIYRDPLRAAVVRAVGGAVPVWKGHRGIEEHIAAARAVLAAGARFGAFLERGPAVPIERARPFGAGIGYIALRTGALIVPIVIGGPTSSTWGAAPPSASSIRSTRSRSPGWKRRRLSARPRSATPPPGSSSASTS